MIVVIHAVLVLPRSVLPRRDSYCGSPLRGVITCLRRSFLLPKPDSRIISFPDSRQSFEFFPISIWRNGEIYIWTIVRSSEFFLLDLNFILFLG